MAIYRCLIIVIIRKNVANLTDLGPGALIYALYVNYKVVDICMADMYQYFISIAVLVLLFINNLVRGFFLGGFSTAKCATKLFKPKKRKTAHITKVCLPINFCHQSAILKILKVRRNNLRLKIYSSRLFPPRLLDAQKQSRSGIVSNKISIGISSI